MIEIEKDEILLQVSSVLQFCQNIVMKLSNIKTTPAVPCISETVLDAFGDNNNVLNAKEEDDDCNNNYWWDSNYPPSHFYTLVYDDDELSLYDGDVDMSNSNLTMMEDVLVPSDMAEDVLMQSDMAEDVLMHSVLQFLHTEIPSAIYDPNWREERRKKAIHPEFFLLWNNFSSIFTDEKDECIIQMPVPDDIFKTIDLFNVNARFIGNIPKPSSFPIHGVSSDPDFYHKLYPRNDYYHVQQYCKFSEPYPFGSDYGYETDVGIVAPPTAPIHGYVLRGGSWVLHAVKPGDGSRHSSRRRG